MTSKQIEEKGEKYWMGDSIKILLYMIGLFFVLTVFMGLFEVNSLSSAIFVLSLAVTGFLLIIIGYLLEGFRKLNE